MENCPFKTCAKEKGLDVYLNKLFSSHFELKGNVLSSQIINKILPFIDESVQKMIFTLSSNVEC